MFNEDTELLFPSRVIPDLCDLRGDVWRELIERISDLPENSAEHLAFVLMMVKMGGCITCNADSFRALRGCTQCARQTIRRYRGKDQELIKQYHDGLKEVERYLAHLTEAANR